MIRVGTRESKLARLQTDMVIAELQRKFGDAEFSVVPITTGGDKILDKPLAEIGGRGVFVKELEEALFDDRVDFVVHSLKDLPTDLPTGLCLAAVLMRQDPRDVFISDKAATIGDLPAGATIATSSRRRAAQIAALRSDIKFVDMRGNIPTRLKKLRDPKQGCDAMILAAAGILRLGETDQIKAFLEPDQCTPAVGQGALAVECRSKDEDLKKMLAAIQCDDTRDEIEAERAFLGELGSGCSIPVGALARVDGDKLTILGCVAALDGSKIFRESISGNRSNAHSLGRQLAVKLAGQGAADVLEALKVSTPNIVSPP